MALTIGGKITVGGGITMTSQPYAVIATTYTTSPYVVAYQWLPGSGFGSKYADPTVLPQIRTSCVDVNPAKNAVIIGNANFTPYLNAYAWNTESGFGAKYADPSVYPVSGSYSVNDVKFNATGTAVAVATGQTPYLVAYAWNSATGFGTKYANPSTSFGSQAVSIGWSPLNDSLVVGGTESGGSIAMIQGFKWNDATGFGTAYTGTYSMIGSGTQPSQFTQISFNPSGTVVAATPNDTALAPAVFAWAWNANTGFGTRYSNPASLPIYNAGAGVAFSRDGTAVILSDSYTSSYALEAYYWNDSTGWGTKYSAPSVAPGGANMISLLANGTAFAMVISGAVVVYEWNSATGFGTRYQQSISGVNGGIAFTA